MSKRVVVITGGGSGMGRAAALEFAKRGDTVYILGRREEKLWGVAKESSTIYPIACDVTDLQAVETARDEIVRKHKGVDVLVHSAGGNLKHKPDDPTPAQALAMWREVIMINLDSAFIVTTAFLPFVRERGRIILIGSSSGVTGSSQPGVTGLAYASAKAGLVGLMRTLVTSLGEKGTTINTIMPGPVDHTDFFPDSHLPARISEIYKAKTPLPEFATVENVAAAILFLASEGAGATTGELLNVSSGMLYSR